MKFLAFFVPLLATSAVAVPAAPVEARDVTVESVLTGLTSQVKQYTGSMNATLASVSQGGDRKAAVASVNSDLKNIAAAIHTATSQIAPTARRQQPTLGDLPTAVLGQLNGQPIILAKLLLPLLQELDPALQSVLTTLSLGEVYLALQPLLTTELPALVTQLSGLVQGLLAALSPLLAGVGSLLAPILLGLGL